MSDEVEQLPHLAEEIKKYLKANRITGEQLIVQLVEESRKKNNNKAQDSKRVRISAFAELLCERISFLIKRADVILNCEFIDIDKDGFIDQNDLHTFLSRYSFFEHSNQERTSTAPNTSRSSGQFHFKPATITTVSSNKLSNFEAAKESLINSQVRLYPTDALSLDKLQVILSDLKRNAHLRRLSFYDIFKTLDSNNDGFVNFSEFEENINSFIQLSSHAKEGLFAFLDHLKIGMFDFPRLASVLSRITISESQEPQKRESWSWEEGILEEMRKWKKTNGLSDQEAFRVADIDFDGFVSKEDLKGFIVKTLKNYGNMIQSITGDSNIHVDRLYQLIDVYKKGYIQPHDFAQIFQSKEEEMLKESSAQSAASQLGFSSTSPLALNFSKLKTRTADGRSRNQIPKMVTQLSSNGFPANSSSALGVNKSITSKSIQQLSNKSAYFQSEIPLGNSTVRGDESKQLLPSKNVSGSQFTAFLKPKSTVHFGNTLAVEKWMVNCCQQMALRVSQNFKDLYESFEIISNHSSKIEFHKFAGWISSGNVLHGFNLTDNFLQQLFAFMDPHKKGYLTESDWISALEIYIESSQTPISDLHDIVKFSFASPKEAFKFFMFGEKDKSDSTNSSASNTKNNNFLRNTTTTTTTTEEGVSFQKFKFSLDSLFKQVYPESTVKAIWNSLHSQLKSDTQTPLTLAHFEQLFNAEFKQKKPLGTLKKRAQSQQKQLRVANIEKLRNSEQFKSSQISQTSLLSANAFSLHDDVINKFKYLLLSKGVNLQNILQKNDVNSTGFVSTQQLKNIIMSLNIGVSSKDIDYLMVFADPQNVATINYKNFLQKLAFNNSQQSLINRSKKRLQSLKHFLYSYLISPKDAFKEFDEARKGVMTLEDFRYFLVKMSKLEQSDVPSYSISKDMFDQIDLKHDGLIDLEEWLQAFMDYGQSDDVLNIEKEKESSRLAFARYHRTKLDFIDHAKKNTKNSNNNNNSSNLRLPATTLDSINGSQTVLPLSKNGNLTVDDIARNSSTAPLTWERSQQYDEALFLIARNRRYLIEQFDKLFEDSKSKGVNQVHEKCLLPVQVNQVFRDFLATHKIFTTDENLAVLYNFAVKRGEINYVYLIDIFKSRLDLKHNPPKRIV